jgi:predicted MFS family arabinose efflux permease
MASVTSAKPPPSEIVSGWLIALLAMSCGLIVANLYYAQPLIGPISADLGLPPQSAGVIVTMAQVGYATGLLLIVPLGDLIENRRLIVGVMVVGALALMSAAFSTRPLPFLASSLFIGLGSVSVQVLVPYAGHLAPAATRGRVVGNVTTGLLIGIMLSRPASGFIASISSWHVVYGISTAVMVSLALVLSWILPVRVPTARLGYGALLSSMAHLLKTNSILRRRAFSQACLFGAFSLFWTTIPLLLAGPSFRLSQVGIAWFALAGAAGAIAAPIAGRIADRWIRLATAAATLLTACGFALSLIFPPGSPLSMAALVAAAIMIDFAVQANLVFGYRALFVLGAEFRSRLNGLYMTTFFLAGATGSAVGGWAFAKYGWTAVSWMGIALPLVALAYLAIDTVRVPAE